VPGEFLVSRVVDGLRPGRYRQHGHQPRAARGRSGDRAECSLEPSETRALEARSRYTPDRPRPLARCRLIVHRVVPRCRAAAGRAGRESATESASQAVITRSIAASTFVPIGIRPPDQANTWFPVRDTLARSSVHAGCVVLSMTAPLPGPFALLLTAWAVWFTMLI
jgi:hypothetical protein